MKFKADAAYLKAALIQASHASVKRSTLPILMYAKLTAEPAATQCAYQCGSVSIESTDLDVHIRSESPAEVIEPGSALIPLARTLSVLRLLGTGEVTIESNSEKAGSDHSADRLTVRITLNGTTLELDSLLASDYPTLPDLMKSEGELSVPFSLLTEALDTAEVSVTKQETRFQLNGMLLDFDKNFLKVVSTDGHRMTIGSLKLQTNNPKLKIYVPHRAAQAIVGTPGGDADGNVLICPEEEGVVYICGTTRVRHRKLDINFPNYNEVITRDQKCTFVVEQRRLLKSLKLLKIINDNKRARTVRLRVKDRKFTTSTIHDMGGRALDRVPTISTKGSGFVYLNMDYLYDIVNVVGDTSLQFSFTDPNTQLLITPEPPDQRRNFTEDEVMYEFVVMPMRVADDAPYDKLL